MTTSQALLSSPVVLEILQLVLAIALAFVLAFAVRRRQMVALLFSGGALIVILLLWSTYREAWGLSAAALGLLALLALATRDILAQWAAGVALRESELLEVGNLVDTPLGSGKVHSIGSTHTTLTSGREQQALRIPNRMLLNGSLQVLNESDDDAAVSVSLPVPKGIDTQKLHRIAMIAAATSPYASLHKRPRSFMQVMENGRIEMRIEGFVFASGYEEEFKSHLIESWLEATQLHRSEPQTSAHS